MVDHADNHGDGFVRHLWRAMFGITRDVELAQADITDMKRRLDNLEVQGARNNGNGGRSVWDRVLDIKSTKPKTLTGETSLKSEKFREWASSF